MSVDLQQPPYKSSSPAIDSTQIVGAVVIARDLQKSRMFYEDMLGLQCAVIGPGRMLVRSDPRLMPSGVSRPLMLDVRQGEVVNPQRMLHHWGIDLATKGAVDAMRERLVANREAYGLDVIQEASFNHGAYSFYFQDLDSNWWEFQFVPKRPVGPLDLGDVA
ncbi:VOC family protein [Piscinibacter sp.]|uniref:VOC family protein n=1 Tax=Piscinibacter sp. TaxID=1903157 RepID=UPI0039E56B1B